MSSADQPVKGFPILVFVAGVLALRAAWAVFVPGGSWPLSPAHYLEMAIDVGLLIAVLGARSQVLSTMPGTTGAGPRSRS